MLGLHRIETLTPNLVVMQGFEFKFKKRDKGGTNIYTVSLSKSAAFNYSFIWFSCMFKRFSEDPLHRVGTRHCQRITAQIWEHFQIMKPTYIIKRIPHL